MASIAEINRKAMAAEDRAVDFQVLSPCRPGASYKYSGRSELRPLMVIVHPGDAVEPPFGWSLQDYQAVQAFSLNNQVNMALEIAERLETHQMMVLHRCSSSDLLAGGALHWVDPGFAKAVRKASELGAVAYGDDLRAAVDWIDASTYLGAGRAVFMTGAYADAQYGCITAVGSGLLSIQPQLQVVVSEHAPTDNSNHSTRWKPEVASPAPRTEEVAASSRRIASGLH